VAPAVARIEEAQPERIAERSEHIGVLTAGHTVAARMQAVVRAPQPGPDPPSQRFRSREARSMGNLSSKVEHPCRNAGRPS
jgi:hypothetical protein